MRVVPGNAQHIGARAEQQDAFGFSDPSDRAFVGHGGILAVVCDGMGGHANGREAAQGAVRSFLDAYGAKIPEESPDDALKRALLAANGEVRRLAADLGQEGNCGSTLVAATILGDRLQWASVGDSRIYLYDGRVLRLLTTDQVYARRLEVAVRRGILSEEDAARHPDREALISFIGIEELREYEIGSLPDPLSSGAMVLLCSDGLFKYLGETEMLAAFDPDPNRWAENLVGAVTERGNPRQDNITVAILAVDPPPSSSRTLLLRGRGKGGIVEVPRRLTGKILSVGVLLLVLVLGAGVWWFREGRSVPAVSQGVSSDRAATTSSDRGAGNAASPDRGGAVSSDGGARAVVSSDDAAKAVGFPAGAALSGDSGSAAEGTE
jgi:protein phosphatase